MIGTYTNNPLRIVSSVRKCPKLIKNRHSNKRNKAMYIILLYWNAAHIYGRTNWNWNLWLKCHLRESCLCEILYNYMNTNTYTSYCCSCQNVVVFELSPVISYYRTFPGTYSRPVTEYTNYHSGGSPLLNIILPIDESIWVRAL